MEGNVRLGSFSGTQKGFGFLICENEEDIFIAQENKNNAFDGDIVEVKLIEGRSGKRQEGIITKVIERKTKEVVGVFWENKSFGFIVPDNNKIGFDVFIASENTKGAKTGQKVVARILNYGKSGKNPEGKVTEIIGYPEDQGVDVLSIIKAYNLPLEFSKEVRKEIKNIPNKVNSDELIHRKDYRDLLTITIDGEDAKDLDDAISISKEGDIYKLGVHIADVTHYVKHGSAIDKSAYKRGTSVYLIDRVIPMLPKELSNGICSLNANEDRLALSCFIDIDQKGSVLGHKIEETVINVKRRLTYTSVANVLEGNSEEDTKEYEDLMPIFKQMQDLASLLNNKRSQRGSINFDFKESKIILNKKGEPIEIKAYERNVATNIIEEFMLITNETIAENFYWQELPFLYRTHEKPDIEKIRTLEVFINNMGYYLKTSQDEIHPKELQKLLGKVANTAEEAIISRLTLRSMKQAIYSKENSGHFGLSAKYYSHFTAPIRRYPDLQIHRIIKESINGQLSSKKIAYYDRILSEVANHSSKTERVAEDCEREVEKLKKVQYMSKRHKEIYEGIISGITSWGIYIELENTVEGLVHVNNLLDDYYFYDEDKLEMIGKEKGKIYKLGQKVNIIVLGTDLVKKTIDFGMVEDYNGDELQDNC